ncbi:MogA/MoaB family molybdenum cofactor biosynthesis protein [Ureibacillus sinduriensis]|uniref:Molybdenum cofactor biosynthesis protein B n=1 Tax=Ureibacillus sinduriensis BLB-1 = JCM 15800 TaxID=1384057 RepID=A0A0A3I503_9BACL|nr:MogA/MoaB family molybdenum cofactor biosynthesis protein [Ureibacillus sinduriensis]KGR78610.1 molybdenum cofactor biosynthesis protein B [Ureibacillus sinduriensis BLB-1 = JCM 15800]
MSIEEHKKIRLKNVKVMVVTISDTRTFETDKSGRVICELLSKNFFEIKKYEIIKDDRVEIQSTLLAGIQDPDVDVILTNGGTGLSNRDITFDVVDELVDKPIPGFGELFRMLSYEEIGSASMLSRAIAGVAKGTVIFSAPGSTGAVKLAMEKLILPEMVHIVNELKKEN